MDVTPSEWSCHSSRSLQQQPQQRQQQQHRHERTPSTSSAPPIHQGLRRPHPPSGLGVVGADTLATMRASKRARASIAMATEDVPCSCNAGPSARNAMENGAGEQCCCVHQEGGVGDFQCERSILEQERGFDVDANGRSIGNGDGSGGGGCCTFRWSETDKNQSGGFPDNVAGGERGSSDASSAAGMAGGGSAAHPSGMQAVGGVGGGQEGGPRNAVNSGWRVLGGKMGGKGVRSRGGAGGGAVIASGFGAGGFPQNQWNQDQGGSSDDMLILYGSPS